MIGPGIPIFTARQTREAEQRIFDGGTAVIDLMEKAGAAVADAVRSRFDPGSAVVLCGPGNNGGDGYVVARLLAESGWRVRVAAWNAPQTETASLARKRWLGPVEKAAETVTANDPVDLFVDALFGTGLSRSLDGGIIDMLHKLSNAAQHRVAIDLPSGIATDDGSLLGDIPGFDLTVALGTLKPAHLLQPGAHKCGELTVGEIGLEAPCSLRVLPRPTFQPPAFHAHKYSRGYVLIVGGEMQGAAALSAHAAARSGAGYIRLVTPDERPLSIPHAIVRSTHDDLDRHLVDRRVGAVLIGPGLGKDEQVRKLLQVALESDAPLVLDADALTLAPEMLLERLASRPKPTILTPHEGEFAQLFGELPGSKVDHARAAAAKARAIVLLKGSDTVIAAPDGQALITPPSSPWLSTAGTGDVLAGLVTGRLATGADPMRAAAEAQWLHARAAELAGPLLIADDLIDQLPQAFAEAMSAD